MKIKPYLLLLTAIVFSISYFSINTYNIFLLNKNNTGEYFKDCTGNFIQLKVLHQGDDETCGYHALKNSMITSLFIKNPSHTNYLSLLNNEQFATNLFKYETACWRTLVKKERKTLALAAFLYNILIDHFKRTIKTQSLENLDEKEWFPLKFQRGWFKFQEELKQKQHNNTLKDIFEQASLSIAKTIYTKEKNYYKIPGKLISQIFQKIALSYKEAPIKDFDTNFKYYFPHLDKITISWKNNILTSSKVNYKVDQQAIDKEANVTNFLKGEWLFGTELKELILKGTINSLNSTQELQNIIVISPSTELKKELINDSNFKKIFELLKDPSSILILPLVVHLNINGGHWVSFVINKQKECIQYIVADSLSKDILKNNRIQELGEVFNSFAY